MVSNTYIPVLEWCRDITGIGRVGSQYPQDGGGIVPRGEYKPCAQWVIHSRNAAKVLKQIVPYMIIKKLKAEAMIEQVEECYRTRWPRRSRVADKIMTATFTQASST